MANERFDLASILSGINPNIDADVLRAARYFTGDTKKLLQRLMKPSQTEKSAAARLKKLKSEDVLRQEVADLFTGTRQAGERAVAEAAGMGEGLAQSIAAAAGQAAGVAGGDARVAGLLANAAQAAQAPSRAAATGMGALGEAAIRSTSEQQALAQANALLRRTERETELQDIIDTARAERETQRLGLRADQRNNLLTIISSLLGMKPTSSGYGSNSATTSPPGGGGGTTWGDYIAYLTGNNPEGTGNQIGAGWVTSAGIPTKETNVGNIGTGAIPAPTGSYPGKRVIIPGYGPGGSQGPRFY